MHDLAFWPGFGFSEAERLIFRRFEALLESKGFRYLSVPSLIRLSTMQRQGIVPDARVIKIDNEHCLSGSAEQGILEHFADSEVPPMLIWAENQCFRREPEFEPKIRLLEFKKLEQFCFCCESVWQDRFELLLTTATDFLRRLGIVFRVVDVTKRDPGYHKKKLDIEVYTKTWGWVETHSCTYFGIEQSTRFGISGANHTVSNTGVASPRIMLPFLEGRIFNPGGL